ncbi:MAG: HD domain-containing protein [Saprospiraceae bacterium]|nr:HD domain-containing protein [Saprospiraceae bacterium]
MAILREKLPEHLKYHCPEHTEYVLQRAEYIAGKEGLTKKDTYLVKVAALYHDIGFIKGPKEHEKRSCKLARPALRKFNFSDSEIKKICGMIMATRIPQKPKTHLEEVLADADLEYLATNQFFPIGEDLYKELKHFNPKLTRRKWNRIQRDFMENHHYHTSYCKRYKTFRKIRNLEHLRSVMK